MHEFLVWCKIDLLFLLWSCFFRFTDLFFWNEEKPQKQTVPGGCVRSVANYYREQVIDTKELIIYCYIFKKQLFCGVLNHQFHVSQSYFYGSFSIHYAPMREVIFLMHLYGEAQTFILNFGDGVEYDMSNHTWIKNKTKRVKATQMFKCSNQISDALTYCPFEMKKDENCWVKTSTSTTTTRSFNLNTIMSELERIWQFPVRCSLFGCIAISNDQEDNCVLYSDLLPSKLIVKKKKIIKEIGLQRFAAIKTNNSKEREFIIKKLLATKKNILLITSNTYVACSAECIVLDKLLVEKSWEKLTESLKKINLLIIEDAGSFNMRSKYAFLLSQLKPQYKLLFYNQNSVVNILPLSGLSSFKSDFSDLHLNVLLCLQEKNVICLEETKNDFNCVSIQIYDANNQNSKKIDVDTQIQILKPQVDCFRNDNDEIEKLRQKVRSFCKETLQQLQVSFIFFLCFLCFLKLLFFFWLGVRRRAFYQTSQEINKKNLFYFLFFAKCRSNIWQ